MVQFGFQFWEIGDGYVLRIWFSVWFLCGLYKQFKFGWYEVCQSKIICCWLVVACGWWCYTTVSVLGDVIWKFYFPLNCMEFVDNLLLESSKIKYLFISTLGKRKWIMSCRYLLTFYVVYEKKSMYGNFWRIHWNLPVRMVQNTIILQKWKIIYDKRFLLLRYWA